MTHKITFIPSGRGKAQCAPNPEYPNGIALNLANDRQTFCTVALPYPAPECGVHLVECNTCNFSVAVTAAGRPDDPTTITVPCRIWESPELRREQKV